MTSKIRNIICYIIVILSTVIISCGGSGGGGNNQGSSNNNLINPEESLEGNQSLKDPEEPVGVTVVTSENGAITVSWSGNANDGRYRILVNTLEGSTVKVIESKISPVEIALPTSDYHVWVLPIKSDDSEGTLVAANNGSVVSVYNGKITAADDKWGIYTGMQTNIPIVNLLNNDLNTINDQPLEIVAVKDAVNGNVRINEAMIIFESNNIADIDASFIYVVQVKGNNKYQTEGKVILSVKQKPLVVVNSDLGSIQQGAEVYFSARKLLANDVGANLIFRGVLNAVNGTVRMIGDNIIFKSTGLAGMPAQFDYTIVDEYNTEARGTVFITVEPLPLLEAYIYDNISSFETQRLVYTPPTMQTVFDSWGRFDGNQFYENKIDAEAAASQNATSWQFMTLPDRVSMPLNVRPYNGFISLQKVENYIFEATLASYDIDDDAIGLIIAFTREDTNNDGIEDTNYVLSAVRTGKHCAPNKGWGVTYGNAENAVRGSSTNIDWIIEEKEVAGDISGRTGWYQAGKTRVKIVRTGDIIKCYTTRFKNTDQYEATSEIIIDLNSDPRLAKFKGKKSYGFSTYSQPNSSYLDIKFKGGLDLKTMMNVDWDTGKVDVWEYRTNQWFKTAKTIQDVVGYVRVVVNPETGKKYLVKKDSIEPVN